MDRPDYARPDPSAPPFAATSPGLPSPGLGNGTPPPYGAPTPYGGSPHGAVQGYGGQPPIGQVRSTGVAMLLTLVTFGIYPLYYYFCVHEEMKRHTGAGLGGGVALALAFFVGVASPYLLSSEVGQLFSRRGTTPPVTGLTGLWYFPGIFLLVGPIIWFVKTNGALNDYWRSQGATS